MAKCKGCGAEIWWKENPATGKRTPISVATDESHFKDCPKANDFSGSKKKEDNPQ